MIRTATLTAALLLSTAAHAASYYVDSARGSDTANNGTSVSTPFATLQKAANSTAAGDTVYVLPGNGYGGGTSGTAPLVISTSGTGAGAGPGGGCSSPITYTGYSGAFSSPMASGGQYQRPIISSTRGQGAIVGLYPLSCIVISNLELVGHQASLTWLGASQNAAVNAGVGVQSYNTDGIFIAGGTGQIVHHITISGMYIHDFPLGGIAVNYADYVTITNNYTSKNSYYSGFAGSGISTYEPHNLDAGTGTKNIVTGNFATGNINYIPNYTGALSCTAAATASGQANISVSGCTGYVNYTMAVVDTATGCVPPGSIISYFPSGPSGGNSTSQIAITNAGNTTCAIAAGTILRLGYITDGEGIIIDNTSNSQSDSIAYIGRTLVSNNIVTGNGSSGLEAGPSSAHVDFLNNTSILNQTSFLNNSGAPGEISAGGSTDVTVYGNTMQALTGTSGVPLFGPSGSITGITAGNNTVIGGGGTGGTNTPIGAGNIVLPALPFTFSPPLPAAWGK